jgi:vacuolar protein sorting-associated protein 45
MASRVPHDSTMDVYLSFRRYITKILNVDNSRGSDGGMSTMKMFLFDEETYRMISMVYSLAEITNKSVFGTDFLFLRKKKTLQYMDCIMLIRPTKRNLYFLKEELKDPSYGRYRIYFTKSLPNGYLEDLAKADIQSKVEGVWIYFADFCALGSKLFITNFASQKKKKAQEKRGKAPVMDIDLHDPQSQAYLQRAADGILAVLLSLKKKPYIRYSANRRGRAMDLCKMLESGMDENRALFKNYGNRSLDARRTLVLIMDRHDDPATPLINQFTYQAMLHELLAKGIDFNRAEIVQVEYEFSSEDGSKIIDSKTGKQKIKSSSKDLITLNPMTDQEFYGKHQYSTFEKVTVASAATVNQFKAAQKELTELKKTKKVADIQEMLTKMPALKSKEKMATKHNKLATYLQDQFDQKNMLKLILAQQDIANVALGVPASEIKNKILGFIDLLQRNPNAFDTLAPLKLVCLFAIRFHRNAADIRELKNALMSKQHLEEKSVNLVDTLLQHMGEGKRVGDVWAENRSTWKALVDTRAAVIKSRPLLLNVLTKLCTGRNKLPETEYRWGSQQPSDKKSYIPDDVIIFYVGGGTTYKEMETVAGLNASNEKIFRGKSMILGGHTVMRSLNFLSYLDQLASN